jgi:hypothetical protein
MHLYNVIFFFFSISILTNTTGLRVYDCSHPLTSFRAIDLLEPQPCPDPQSDFMAPDTTKIQILQTDTAFPITAHQCKVIITREVVRCGFDSNHYGSEWPVWQHTIELTPQECRHAVTTHAVTIDDRTLKAEMGRTTTHHYFSHGSRDSNGFCKTADFTTAGTAYFKSYERTMVDITIRGLRGTADLTNGRIIFTNGLRADFMDGTLTDQQEGTLVWRAREQPCRTTANEIYFGNATIHRKWRNGDDEAIVLVADPLTNQYAGLQLRSQHLVCGLLCHNTQIRGLMGCILRQQDAPLPHTLFKSSFNPTSIDLQTKLAFRHLGVAFETFDRFITLQQNICDVDRRAMTNKMHMIAGGNNQYALLEMFGPGHKVYVAGAAAYIASCHPREALSADYPNCTTEIPVRVNGTRRFADPFSWTLSETPTVVPCDHIIPISWRINGFWYCSDPAIHRCQPPEQLNITNSVYITQGQIPRSPELGIFTPAQLARHRAYTLSMASRLPAMMALTNTMTRDGLDSDLGTSLSQTDLLELRREVVNMTFPMINWFGEAWTYLSGLFLLGLLIKLCCNIVLRSTVLYSERGCGRWMLTVLWSTPYLIARTPWEAIRRAGDALIDPTPPPKDDASDDSGTDTDLLEERVRELRKEVDLLHKYVAALLPALQQNPRDNSDTTNDPDHDSNEGEGLIRIRGIRGEHRDFRPLHALQHDT